MTDDTQPVPRDPAAASLWRDRPFMALWTGQTVSQVGSAVTALVLPLMAIEELGAGPAQIGVLRAMFAFAAILAAVPGGVMVDRSRKRRVMIGCDLLMALSLVSLPVAAFLGVLSLAQVYLVAFANGAFALVFGVAYHAYIPSVVTRAQIKEANTKLAATEALARVSGPALGATLVAWIGAATTVLLDVVSYLVSAVTTWRGTPREDRARANEEDEAPRPSMWTQAREGARLVIGNTTLTQTAVTTIGSMMAFAMFDAVLLYFMLTDLGVSTGVVGVVFAIGEGGGLVAALFAGRFMNWVGGARVMWIAVLLSPVAFLPAVASGPSGVYLIAVFGLLSSARFVVFDIAQYVYRQTVCPPEALGRVTATIRMGIAVSTALGALLGGFLGDAFSPRTALVAAAIVTCMAGLPVLLSSELRRARDIEDLASLTPLQEDHAAS